MVKVVINTCYCYSTNGKRSTPDKMKHEPIIGIDSCHHAGFARRCSALSLTSDFSSPYGANCPNGNGTHCAAQSPCCSPRSEARNLPIANTGCLSRRTACHSASTMALTTTTSGQDHLRTAWASPLYMNEQQLLCTRSI
jgi:hypothetical protein